MRRFYRSLGRLLFVAMLTPWLFSCGGEEGLSDDVEFTITPENPIASPADTSYVAVDGTVVSVIGPWFISVINIQNKNTQYTLVVDSVEFKIQIRNGNTRLESETTISYEDTGCDPTTTSRTIYGNIPPGGFFTGDRDCDDVIGELTDTEPWYIAELPEGTGLNYFVEATMYGTFRDLTDVANPIRGRVQKTVFFTTQ